MKLEPVYLLPPEPDRRVKMSRRGFVGLALALFAGGAAFGVGASRLFAPSPATRREPTDGIDGDVPKPLEFARKLAVGPPEALARHGVTFVTIHGDWPADDQLRAGLRRLVAYIVSNDDAPNRRLAAIAVLRHLERFPDADEEVRKQLTALRRITLR